MLKARHLCNVQAEVSTGPMPPHSPFDSLLDSRDEERSRKTSCPGSKRRHQLSHTQDWTRLLHSHAVVSRNAREWRACSGCDGIDMGSWQYLAEKANENAAQDAPVAIIEARPSSPRQRGIGRLELPTQSTPPCRHEEDELTAEQGGPNVAARPGRCKPHPATLGTRPGSPLAGVHLETQPTPIAFKLRHSPRPEWL